MPPPIVVAQIPDVAAVVPIEATLHDYMSAIGKFDSKVITRTKHAFQNTTVVDRFNVASCVSV